MISFAMLSPLLRAFLAFWALALCLVNIGSAVFATVKKRFLYTSFAVLLFVPVYFMWQVIFDFSLFGGSEKIEPLSAKFCDLPLVYWLAAFAVLTLFAAVLLGFNIKYDRTYITPGTIKLYLDKMPCGICCWRDNGRVLFSNICMNEICLAITGNPLLNGNHFHEAVKDGILTVDGKVRRFATREIMLDGERLWEMTASDITAEYAKTAALKKDRAELSRLNQELKEYYLSIDESVKRREILQAKINIHDEMNRLMLSTVAADTGDAKALDNIFSLWEKNALLLCMEADARRTDYVESLANALNITLIWHSGLPKELDGKKKELFLFAAQEAIINAAKHAHAKTMEISFENTEKALICRFTNDGMLPTGEVRFEGGLANLAHLAKKQNASVCTEGSERFTLILHINHPFG